VISISTGCAIPGAAMESILLYNLPKWNATITIFCQTVGNGGAKHAESIDTNTTIRTHE
jgi:hypothetical protein